MTLKREELLKPRFEKVRIPALGGDVCLLKLSAGEVVNMDSDDVGLMLARSLADENGERMFSDDEKDRAMGMPIEAVNQIAEAIGRVNGFNQAEQEKN